jgi:hypothetical protein
LNNSIKTPYKELEPIVPNFFLSIKTTEGKEEYEKDLVKDLF